MRLVVPHRHRDETSDGGGSRRRAARAFAWSTSEYIDEAAFAALLVDMSGDDESTRRFVEDFVSLWETRAQRLTNAFAEEETEAAYVVLLSIRASARMLGAIPLEAAALRMLAALQTTELLACSVQIADVLELGENSCLALTARLAHPPACA
ncbi:hypothetical protein [Glaciibacter psychrotolerans]|uniref:Hpt domain-containing protein n=1 Tax=Glaciibacter psychrotolerans TaxID=670054 RepID=A0A7Z0J6D4_9MICO|nr:hypothetical protein [Leifsonia psychrotolerans]NYJ20407.1 hypothetical protein [Leifsonia psychrotolerans]